MSYSFLVVDDSPIIRKMVRRTLGMAGFEIAEVHEAGNGKEALEVLAGQWVDIVLSDIHMPEMTGIELVEHMVKDEQLKRIPVVIISTERSAQRIDYMKSLGIRGYITKPFTPEAIRDTVTGALSAVLK